jgi:putative transposase
MIYCISRQGYYQQIKRESRKQLESHILFEKIQEVRKDLPRVGGRKLHYMLKDELRELGIKMGRDCFFEWLGKEGLLIRPRKQYVRTTNSNHPFRVYKNLFQHKEVTDKNQVWVSDITYLRTGSGFSYLALITDAWSRKIVGYDVSNSLELTGCLRALKQATKQLPANYQLIHHSDRGTQYCSHQYTKLLKKNQIKISMADRGNCYQNAIAERVNGILKDEFYLNANLKSLKTARKSVDQAIDLYNNIRPHMSINYLTPNAKHAA